MAAINFTPEISDACKQIFFERCSAFQAALEDGGAGDQKYWKVIEDFRASNRSLGNQPTAEHLKLLVSLHVVADLVAQGWTFNVTPLALELRMDDTDETLRSKDQVRRRHLLERDNQLREPATREFVRNMERRRLTPKGWQSVFSLMRDGRQLAEDLRLAAAIPDEGARNLRLDQLVQPYFQFVRPGEVCDYTGLALTDIWRYFRHTWVTAYRSVPGRSMMILVRDAAAPNHPVVGIAALGSAVVQQTVRDAWIGWDAAGGVERLLKLSPQRLMKWIFQELEDFIAGIHTRDLVRMAIISRKEITHPTPKTVERLREAASAAILEHRKHPQKSIHKTVKDESLGSLSDWQTRAETSLFRSKRCKLLASLLDMRRTLADAFDGACTQSDFVEVVKTGDVKKVLSQLIRLSKAERVGINMMDITVCGAVAPYNTLLGGKLICLLLCSPEVGKAYASRYSKQPSLIASCMKGAPVVRQPQLALLGTTSLYGRGSSQYNRVRVATEHLGGAPGGILEYRELGLSLGYGSFHLSDETVNVMTVLLGRVSGGRRVNSIFGEGVNPLMRKIREALDLIGIASEEVLRHGNQRIVYGVALASNLQDFLLGLDRNPKYLLPQRDAHEVSEHLAAFWRHRWLSRRILQPSILERVADQALDFPVTHGARVTLPVDDSDDYPRLFQ